MVQEVTRSSSRKMTRTTPMVYSFPCWILYPGVPEEQEIGERLPQPSSIGSRNSLSLASVKFGLLVRN
jgi:hypothetical protein